MENKTTLETHDPCPEVAETAIAPDWTESEWFEVWLKLARREYEPDE